VLLKILHQKFQAVVTVHHERRAKREKPTNPTNLMFIIELISQHVSGIIMPIFRRTRLCTTLYGVLHWLC